MKATAMCALGVVAVLALGQGGVTIPFDVSTFIQKTLTALLQVIGIGGIVLLFGKRALVKWDEVQKTNAVLQAEHTKMLQHLEVHAHAIKKIDSDVREIKTSIRDLSDVVTDIRVEQGRLEERRKL